MGDIQQFKGSSEPSKQSWVPSHCQDAGKHSTTAYLVVHWNSVDLHLTAKTCIR